MNVTTRPENRPNISLARRAWAIRRHALRMGQVQGQGYIGQALGIADVLAVAYFVWHGLHGAYGFWSSITLDERRLVIGGLRQDPEPKQTYYQMEIGYGEFHVEVWLPWIADPDCVEATYEAGFLRVFLPRPPACRVRTVTPGKQIEESK